VKRSILNDWKKCSRELSLKIYFSYPAVVFNIGLLNTTHQNNKKTNPEFFVAQL